MKPLKQVWTKRKKLRKESVKCEEKLERDREQKKKCNFFSFFFKFSVRKNETLRTKQVSTKVVGF